MAKAIVFGLLVVGLLGLTLPASAEPDILEWSEVNIPTDGKPGGWLLASSSDIQHLSRAIDGSLYADKVEGTTHHLMKSTDEGLTWEETDYEGGAIAGADGYELVISTEANLGNPTILKSGDYALPTTAWQCNIALNYNTPYYWKARAISADTCSAWSAVSAFTTELPPSPESTSAPEPPQSQSDDSDWPDWLVPLGIVFLIAIVMVLITMIIVVIRATR